MTQSEFLTICHERGFVHQCTDERNLDALLAECKKQKKPLVAYIGFDCTAPSLHVGSLIQIMILRWLQKCGHKPIVLMGGGTTKVGDPSGKDRSRQMLDDAAIQKNMEGIRNVFSQFLGQFESTFNADSTSSFMVNNADWLENLTLIDFLRDYGRLFSVNRMLTMEGVKQRLERESHLSFLEFNYLVLQAYDFLELYCRTNKSCRLQIGGSDQWGNIVSGVELFRKWVTPSAGTGRTIEEARQNRLIAEANKHYDVPEDHPIRKHDLFGLTTPLLTTASGAKMGKTAAGAVWLNGDMCSPYDYWQYWRNTEDADVGRFLRLFTELPLDEIKRLEALPGQEINEAKKVLATEATALLHGRAAAKDAAHTAMQTFEQGKTAGHLPEAVIPLSELTDGAMAAFKLFHLAGLAPSSKEAKRLIQGGGARINDEPVTEENASIPLAALAGKGPVKLSVGKKKHVRLRLA